MALSQPVLAADWSVENLRRGPPATAGGTATAADGQSHIDLGCNSQIDGIAATLHDYAGSALQRIDDESETVTFEVTLPDKRQAFTTRMHYVEHERAWVVTDWLPVAFLTDFSAGETMVIRNAAGREVVRFGLSGSAEVAAKMREYCG